jgi:hypothetical protein
MSTTRKQLQQVQAAIKVIEDGGQSYTMDDTVVGRGDLATLYAQERTLQTRLNRETRGGMRVRFGLPFSG